MAVTLTPSLAAGLGAAPTDKAHLRAWLEAIVAAINADLDPRAVPIYASRDAAVANAPSLPASLPHIAVREGTALVIRSRTAFADDPLFPTGARWGVVQRQDMAAEAKARTDAIRNTGVLPLESVAGTGNAITAEIAAAVPGVTLSSVSTVELIAAADNTGAVTLNVAGAGAWPVHTRGGAELQPADLKAGRSYLLRRRGNTWRMINAADSEIDARVVPAQQAASAATAAANAAAGAVAEVREDLDGKIDGGAMFHRGDGLIPLVVGAGGQIVLGLDADGQPLAPFVSEAQLAAVQDSVPEMRSAFHVADNDDIAFAIADARGRVLGGWDESGNSLGGGGGGGSIDFSTLPTSSRDIANSAPWRDRWTVRLKRPLGNIYTTPVDTLFPNAAAIYARLDALQAEFPDYLTRSVIGQSRNGMDIVAYQAKPADYIPAATVPAKRPKIIIFSGTHGNEKHCVVSHVAFMESLCREWKTRDPFWQLRWGCNLIMVPCINPDGFTANTRHNAQDVDLNRNYPTRWSDADSKIRGSAPASEPETQAAIALMTANLDAFALIDFHRMFREVQPDGSEFLVWVGTETAANLALGERVIDLGIAESRRHMTFSTGANPRTGQLSMVAAGSTAPHAMALGIPAGFLLETPDEVGGTIADTREHAERMLINLVMAAYERERRRRETQ